MVAAATGRATVAAYAFAPDAAGPVTPRSIQSGKHLDNCIEVLTICGREAALRVESAQDPQSLREEFSRDAVDVMRRGRQGDREIDLVVIALELLGSELPGDGELALAPHPHLVRRFDELCQSGKACERPGQHAQVPDVLRFSRSEAFDDRKAGEVSLARFAGLA
jgi:hypothetical protein